MKPKSRFSLSKLLIALLFGCSSLYVDAQAQEQSPEEGWVEVETDNLLPTDITGIYYLIPYRNRREPWGQTVSVGYSSFSPSNYEPNFITSNFDEIYPTAEMPLLELQFSIKRNFLLGSLAGELGAGIYQNASDSDLIESDLEVIPVRAGLTLSLDNLFFEPYVVPYFSGGIYTVIYSEAQGTTSVGGNTQIAPYYGLGLSFQLNWLDREAARLSYLESGIENTFVFIEARQFLASSAPADPDFSTGLDWGAGMRLEF